jgi:hypothetical protein
MILPTKRIPEDRALLAIGADVLSMLPQSQTVSKLWDSTKLRRSNRIGASPLPFDWFLLSLAVLFSIGAVELRDGRLHRVVR